MHIIVLILIDVVHVDGVDHVVVLIHVHHGVVPVEVVLLISSRIDV